MEADRHDELIYLYGIGGQRLGTFVPDTNTSTVTFTGTESNVYFGGRLVARVDIGGSGTTESVYVDRLGSVAKRGATAMRYYPYGEEKGGTTTQERDKFGTYFRDSVTNLDYAQQRYYSSVLGRFLSGDPYVTPNAVAEPQGWNRYAYVMGDPVNYGDPDGLNRCNSDLGVCYMTNIYFTFYMMQGVGVGQNAGPSPEDKQAQEDQKEYDKLITDANLEMLERRIQRLGNCAKILGKMSAADFWAKAKTMRFYDGRPTSPGASRSQHAIVGNDKRTSIEEAVRTIGTDIAVTLTGPNGLPSKYVVLGRDYYGDYFREDDKGNILGVSQADTLLHEALHYVFGMFDGALENYLAEYGFTNPDKGSSHDISEWLTKDCQ